MKIYSHVMKINSHVVRIYYHVMRITLFSGLAFYIVHVQFLCSLWKKKNKLDLTWKSHFYFFSLPRIGLLAISWCYNITNNHKNLMIWNRLRLYYCRCWQLLKHLAYARRLDILLAWCRKQTWRRCWKMMYCWNRTWWQSHPVNISMTPWEPLQHILLAGNWYTQVFCRGRNSVEPVCGMFPGLPP